MASIPSIDNSVRLYDVRPTSPAGLFQDVPAGVDHYDVVARSASIAPHPLPEQSLWKGHLNRPSARLLLAPTEGLSRTQVIVEIERLAAAQSHVCCVLENSDMAATHAVRGQINAVIAQNGVLVIAAGPGGIENPNAFNTLIDDYAADGEPGKRASQMRVVVVLPTGFLLDDTAFVSRFEAHMLAPSKDVLPLLWQTPSVQQYREPSISRVVVWETSGMDARLDAAFQEARAELLVCVPEPSEHAMRCLHRLCSAHPDLRVFVQESFQDHFIRRRNRDAVSEEIRAVDEASLSTAFASESAQAGTSCLGPLSDTTQPAPQVTVVGPLSDASWQMLASAPNPCWPPQVVAGIPVPSWASDVVRIPAGGRAKFNIDALPRISCVIHASDPGFMCEVLVDNNPDAICVGIASDLSAGAFLQRAGRDKNGSPVRVDTPLLQALNNGGEILIRVDHAPDVAKCLGLLLMTPPRGMVSGRMTEFQNARVILITDDPSLVFALPGAVHLDDKQSPCTVETIMFPAAEVDSPCRAGRRAFFKAIDAAFKSDPETLARHRHCDSATFRRVIAYTDDTNTWMFRAVQSALSGEFGDGSEAYAKLLYTVSENATTHDFDPRGVFRVIDDMRHPSQLLDYQYRIANEVTRPVFDAVMAHYPQFPLHGLAVLICHAAKTYPKGSPEYQIAQWIADGVGLPDDAIMPIAEPASSIRDLYAEQLACVELSLATHYGCALIGPPCSGKSRALDMLEKSHPGTVRLIVAHFPNATLLANAVENAYANGAPLVIIDEADLLDLRNILPRPNQNCKLVIAGNGLQDDRVALPDWMPLVRFPEVVCDQDLLERFIIPAKNVRRPTLEDDNPTQLLAVHRMMRAMDHEGRVTPRLIQEVYRRFYALLTYGISNDIAWPLVLTQVYLDGVEHSHRQQLLDMFQLNTSLISDTLKTLYEPDGSSFPMFPGRENDFGRLVEHLWVLRQARRLPDHSALRGTSSAFAIEGPPGIGKDAMTRAALCLLDGDRTRTWTQVRGGSTDVVWAVQHARQQFFAVVVSELNTFNAQAIHAGLHSDERLDLGMVVSLGNPPDANQGRGSKGSAAASREVKLLLEEVQPASWAKGALRYASDVSADAAAQTAAKIASLNENLLTSGSPLRATFRQMVAMFADPAVPHLDYYQAVIQASTGSQPGSEARLDEQCSVHSIAIFSAIAGVPVRFHGPGISTACGGPTLASDGALVFPGYPDHRYSEDMRHRSYDCMAMRLGLFDIVHDQLMKAWLYSLSVYRAELCMPMFMKNKRAADQTTLELFRQRVFKWSRNHIFSLSPASARAFGHHVRKVFAEVNRAIEAGEPLDPYVFMDEESIDPCFSLRSDYVSMAALRQQLTEDATEEGAGLPVCLPVPPRQTAMRALPAEPVQESAPVAPTVVGVRNVTSVLYCPAWIRDPDGTCRAYPLASANAGSSQEMDRHVVAVRDAPGAMIALRVPEGTLPTDVCFISKGHKIPVRALEPDVDVARLYSSYAVRVPKGLPDGSSLSYRLVKATKSAVVCRDTNRAVDALHLGGLPDDRLEVINLFLHDAKTKWMAQSVKYKSKAALIRYVCDWVKTTFKYAWAHEQGATTGMEMLRTGSGNCVAAQDLAWLLLVRLGARRVLRIGGYLLQTQEIKSCGHAWLEYKSVRYDPTPSERLHHAKPVLARVAMPVAHHEGESGPVVLVREAKNAHLNDLQKQRMNNPHLRARGLANECLFQQTVMAKSVADPHGDDIRITASGDVVSCTRAGKRSPKPRVLFLGSHDAVRMAADPLGLWLPALAVFFEEGRGRLYVSCKHADGHSDVTCVKSCAELFEAIGRVPQSNLRPEDELAVALSAKAVTHGAQILSLDALRSEAKPRDAGSQVRRAPRKRRHSWHGEDHSYDGGASSL